MGEKKRSTGKGDLQAENHKKKNKNQPLKPFFQGAVKKNHGEGKEGRTLGKGP